MALMQNTHRPPISRALSTHMFTACIRNLLVSPISSKVFGRSSPKYLTHFWATRVPILLDDVYGILYADNKDIWSSSYVAKICHLSFFGPVQQQCYNFLQHAIQRYTLIRNVFENEAFSCTRLLCFFSSIHLTSWYDSIVVFLLYRSCPSISVLCAYSGTSERSAHR